MTIIVYKIRLGRYELTDIKDSGGEEIRIIFEEPTDGKLTLGERVFNVTRGICKLTSRELPEGDISPKLITGGVIRTLEGFVSRGGSVIRKCPDEEYIRLLAKTADELTARVKSLEDSLLEIKNKISQRIVF